jgi:nicotinamidase-related amidase
MTRTKEVEMRRIALLCGVVACLAASVAAAEAPAKPEAVAARPALLVMDVQNLYLGYMDQTDRDMALLMVNATIDLFRSKGYPVIRVYHTDLQRGPAPGSEPFEYPATIRVRPEDPMVVKHHPSAFVGTELEQLLRDSGCDTVFITGLSAVGCALATYFDADGRDLKVFMVKGALLSHRSDLTRTVEDMTDAVGYEAVEYMLRGAPPVAPAAAQP